MIMSFKNQPGLFQKTTEKARVLSQEPHFKNRKDIQFVKNEYNQILTSTDEVMLKYFAPSN